MSTNEHDRPHNSALWMPKRRARFEVGPASYTAPGPHEIVVRARAVAVNLVDAMAGPAYRVVVPWLRYPAIIGSDVAGNVVEVGSSVTGFAPGDRVLGHAMALEKSQNRAAEGAYQQYVVLMEHMVSAIPESLPFEQASVVPLTLSTAATGMFQQDHLGLHLPTAAPDRQDAVVLVWGAATGVGMNATQLAKNAGYDVVATASPRTAEEVRSLGADAVIDRTATDAVEQLVRLIGDRTLAGTMAIGRGSLPPCIAVAERTTGTRRVASSQPDPASRIRGRLAARRGVHVSYIWGGTLKDNEVGPAVYRDFLPGALASGVFRAEPKARIVGDGLAALPDALAQVRSGGLSAEKIVVAL
ncbi:zinc-binding dehydrogenase [Gordonia sp. HNM0687]|uniref:Zinc-binding dehydrogenase n=1 Tax=Gordonia mangrovi TaxID=2665643 RepID=A0A6L7GLZ0_9ACTN|nr:zinc-binding alcohol dehydrogenase family protein [Gordonia mangrovi]MXP20261.1 zinc-binding dehydrogenase [Gordonia mangrovi]UVF79134.1 zinc-binding alcohol dehydrogenase family protein [Gordonia mangrovi]